MENLPNALCLNCKSKRKAMNRNWYNQKANPALVSLVGYLRNRKNGKKGYSYNLMLKNIPYHIMPELKSIPIMTAPPRTHLYW